MDYSILIGIEQVTDPEQKDLFVQNQNGTDFKIQVDEDGEESSSSEESLHTQFKNNPRIVVSQCGNFIYHICIIDYLQSFNYNKRAEIVLKMIFKNAKSKDISSMDPQNYFKRYMKFMKTQVFVDPESIKETNSYKQVYIDDQTIQLIENMKRNYSTDNL